MRIDQAALNKLTRFSLDLAEVQRVFRANYCRPLGHRHPRASEECQPILLRSLLELNAVQDVRKPMALLTWMLRNLRAEARELARAEEVKSAHTPRNALGEPIERNVFALLGGRLEATSPPG